MIKINTIEFIRDNQGNIVAYHIRFQTTEDASSTFAGDIKLTPEDTDLSNLEELIAGKLRNALGTSE